MNMRKINRKKPSSYLFALFFNDFLKIHENKWQKKQETEYSKQVVFLFKKFKARSR